MSTPLINARVSHERTRFIERIMGPCWSAWYLERGDKVAVWRYPPGHVDIPPFLKRLAAR